jgi:hypothetical protein
MTYEKANGTLTPTTKSRVDSHNQERNCFPHPSVTYLRKRDKLRVFRQAVLADATFLKVLFHVNSPRLIETDIPSLHNSKHICLRALVET